MLATMMFSEDDARFLRRAIDLAIEARARGDKPFGAILVHNGEIVMEARNAVHSDTDVTQHAETRLVSKACRTLPADVLENSTLYTSTEPCQMCSSAISWARVPRVVFGYAATSLKALVYETSDIEPHAARYEGPWLTDEAFAPHEGYWHD
jgi:tRNA(Arg) A34 adenosine deaminase TadA